MSKSLKVCWCRVVPSFPGMTTMEGIRKHGSMRVMSSSLNRVYTQKLFLSLPPHSRRKRSRCAGMDTERNGVSICTTPAIIVLSESPISPSSCVSSPRRRFAARSSSSWCSMMANADEAVKVSTTSSLWAQFSQFNRGMVFECSWIAHHNYCCESGF